MRSEWVLAVLVHAGCSFVGVTGPPARPTEPISCTDTIGFPLVDALGGLAIGAVAGVGYFGLAQSEAGPTASYVYAQATVTGVGVSLPWLIGATYGVVQIRRCRALKAVGKRARKR